MMMVLLSPRTRSSLTASELALRDVHVEAILPALLHFCILLAAMTSCGDDGVEDDGVEDDDNDGDEVFPIILATDLSALPSPYSTTPDGLSLFEECDQRMTGKISISSASFADRECSRHFLQPRTNRAHPRTLCHTLGTERGADEQGLPVQARPQLGQAAILSC